MEGGLIKMFGFGKRKWKSSVEKWYKDMVRKYNITEEEELEYLNELADELNKTPLSASALLVFLVLLGLVLLSAGIGILILLFAFWWASKMDKDRANEAEKKFLMWRMSRRG